ncbi:hypothetical protein, partial [Alistipes finegoldii]|uniref:hypothetical protein n=1 Tax=Alistipes finegoldii TaxID=214856 RepID=UPI002673CBDB
FPVGCSQLVVPGWLFLFGSCCFRPVAGYSRPASVVPARLRLPFLDFSCPAPALLPPPGFGCSRPVVGASCRRSLQKKSRMFVPFRIFSYI